MKDKDTDSKTTKKNNNQQLVKYIRLYVIPIFAITFFIVILIFLTIPKISEIFASLDTIAHNNEQIAANNAEVEALNGLTNQYNIIVRDLAVIDGIAPVGSTEVVRFRDRISGLISSNGLTIISQRLSEANTESDTQNNASPIILQEVPFLFTVQGNFPNVVSFIQSLNSVEDFIVVKELQLGSSSGENTDVWELKINIVKYQFNSPTNVDLKSIYTGVPIEATLNSLLQLYIANRSDVVIDENGNSTLPDDAIQISIPQE